MADNKQLKIIKKGSEAWNKYRNNNPEIKINLSNANLSGANLRRAKLSDTN